MRATTALFCLKFTAIAYGILDSPRPRGVSPRHAKFYNATSQIFTCILNPTIQIPFDRVNDDFCDCPDGTDEPGTSACSYITPLSPRTPADIPHNTKNYLAYLAGFYCQNKGHRPGSVPFERVNDGVCDYEQCCDGSEEWAGVGGVKCPDRCAEIGKEWKAKDERRRKSLGKAQKKRREMVKESVRLRKEVEDRIKTLGTEIEGAEIRVKQLEGELAEVEKKERGRVVREGQGGGGKLGVLVGLVKPRIEELRSNLISVRGERDDYHMRLNELEELLTTFKEEYNPNFNDEGVKRAVRAWEDYAAGRGKSKAPSDLNNIDLDSITGTDDENGIDWEEYETSDGEASDTDVLYAFESYLPPTLRHWLDHKLRDLRLMLIDSGILADKSSKNKDKKESKALTDARNRLSTAKSELSSHQSDIESHQDDLSKDFGKDDIFRSLKGTCISKDSGEYTYELCFLDRTTQKPKKGGGNTSLGKFDRFETIDVDEDMPADGKGLGRGERVVMKFENGQHCWNGPNRRTDVVLACAEENEIWRVREEEKCVYRLEVGTPAVCEDEAGGVKTKDEGGKDEL